MTVSTVRVGLGARSYDILIGDGVLDRAGALMKPLLTRPQTVIISEETVFAAQGARLETALADAGIAFETLILPAGEDTKSFAQLERLTARLLDLDVDRGDAVIAFGGGVIGDLVGFAAAILKRGCRFIQVPTSLLAQVDSAVGGKTAINVPQGKNLIGAFHQPSLVIADVAALTTLDDRQMRAGYAEIVKYGALGDADFFAWLEQNGRDLVARKADALIAAVERSCEMKAAIVADDETERGNRALLNLGHTFGHALEAVFGFSDALLHGEAVAAGMGLAADYSVNCGYLSPASAARLKAHLRAAGLPASIADLEHRPSMTAGDLTARMMKDKKIVSGKLSLILLREIGEAFVERDVDISHVNAFLTEKAGA
ncbi:MAG: 3-dehydroquinate synthase [Pseudomonadota bacterium]